MRTLGVSLLLVLMIAVGCQAPVRSNLPPSDMLMHPGPGVDGPGPGVMMYQPITPMPPAASQVYFVGPEGMQVQWDVMGPGRFDSQPLVAPGRTNFPQGAIYRLKLTNVPGRPGVELYPTLEVGPSLPRTEAFLAHNAIPVELTDEDFDQVLSGNFVTKVIYLPDPEFQQIALAGVGTLVSTRLDPGVDPIVEADRQGAIMAIVRLGNKDLQIPMGPAAGPDGEVRQMSYVAGGPGAPGMPLPMGGYPLGMPTGMPNNMPSNYIAGVTAPQYGMPMCGTPIGLPGPPHVPLGVPAGLQSHSIVNHTSVKLPEPTTHMRIDVKQRPGMSYPTPVNHIRIAEHAGMGLGAYCPPGGNCLRKAGPGCEGGSCPVGYPAAGGDPGVGGAPAGCGVDAGAMGTPAGN